MKVDILMAVYNGEKYIAKQIESIINQSHENWTLIIRDDASTDNTRVIIRQYIRKYPDKIKFFSNMENSGSPKSNFFELIKSSDADVIFTCDQDDIWEKDKVEITLREFENVHTPLLVHTDLKVIDNNDNVIAPSMIKLQHINVNRINTNQLLVQNVVTGCTMAFNRELADILKEPEILPVHDWWIAAVASIFGNIEFINKATVLYRRHNNNVCGPQNAISPVYLIKRFADKKRAKKMLELGSVMAIELLEKYDIPYNYRPMLKAYAKIAEKNKLQKLAVIIKYGIWKGGFIRKAGQIWFM